MGMLNWSDLKNNALIFSGLIHTQFTTKFLLLNNSEDKTKSLELIYFKFSVFSYHQFMKFNYIILV